MIEEKAYAKLNISLDVGKVRKDGYHEMNMVMLAVSLCDNIQIELQENGESFAECNLPYIPRDGRNLAVKAANAFFEEIGKTDGAKITIHKIIPVGAGMAGGSTDAAAVLRGLNRAYGFPLCKEQLLSVSERVGSDVAFCVVGGTALAEGRGEILHPIKDFPLCKIVIAKPSFSISTPDLFHKIDRSKMRMHPDTSGILEALEEENLPQICRRMYNVFEDVPDRRMKTIAEIKSKISEAGALGTIMTGTGSAVFGIFSKDVDVSGLISALKKEYGFACEASPVKRLL